MNASFEVQAQILFLEYFKCKEKYLNQKDR